jgi:hypothetical protein
MKKAEALWLKPGASHHLRRPQIHRALHASVAGGGTPRHPARRHQGQGHRREALVRAGGIRAPVRRQRGPLGAVSSHYSVTGRAAVLLASTGPTVGPGSDPRPRAGQSCSLCSQTSQKHAAALKVRTGQRVDIRERQRAFGAKAVAHFVREHRATHVIIQEFEND